MAARPRANTATLRDLYDTCLGSGHSPSPVGRTDCVSTWTSMRLASVPCRVLLHSLLPTDDACSSSSLSTTVINAALEKIIFVFFLVHHNYRVGQKWLNFPYFRTPVANFLLSCPNSVEYGNSKTTTLLPSNWLRRPFIRLAWYRHMPASWFEYFVQLYNEI